MNAISQFLVASSRRRPKAVHHSRRLSLRAYAEVLEVRLTPTASIAITNALVVDGSGQPLTVVNIGETVTVQADFNTEDLPSDASYRLDDNVNGLILDTGYITWGAGISGPSDGWVADVSIFVATPGTNQVTVTIDPDHSVPLSNYADTTMSFTFDAVLPAVGNSFSYSDAQIRQAYGIDSIPDFGSASADGSGQTIAIVDAYNDPSIMTDLDSFDQAMSLTTGSTEALYQQYGPASSFLTVYNQTGTNITSEIGDSGVGAVPPVDPPGVWYGEERGDVAAAHAIAPGAKIDLIECDSDLPSDFLSGAATAAELPGVTAVSMSWGYWEFGGETAYDSNTFVTPSGHPGVTFLAASGDGGVPSIYPAFSPNVVAVGATQLSLENNGYGGETAWSFLLSQTLSNGSASYSQAGTWTSQSGGFSGSYSTAGAQSDSSATWTTSITSSDQGWQEGTEVSATWVSAPGNATDATYTIYDGTQATGTVLGTVQVDQTKDPIGTSDGGFQFQNLGCYLSTSGTLTVVLNANSANGTVVADAVGIAPEWATGGGRSVYEPEPSYQLAVQSTGYRTVPDVAFDGSNNSTADFGFGTSVSAPCWAGLIAIVNQGRVALGGSPLNSTANPQQTLEALYSLPAADFNDIPTGYNGLQASSGYDELTGLGSPIANLLVPDLASYGLAQLAISAPSPATVTAGNNFQLTVTVENLAGQVITNYDGNVTISLGDDPDGALLGGNLTVSAVNGVAKFTGLTVDKPGVGYTIQASFGSQIGGTSSAFTVYTGAAARFGVTTTFSDPDVAGAMGTVTVTAYDTENDVAGSGPDQYEGTVDLSNTDPQATGLPATYTFTAADAGSHTFNVVFKTAGNQSIAAVDSKISSIYGSSPEEVVVPQAAAKLQITTSFADPDIAGVPATVTVTALDPFGNVAGSGHNPYEGTVDLSSSDGRATGLPASFTFTAADAGSHSFAGVVLKTAGNQTIVAIDSVTASIAGASPPVVVAPATVATLVVTTNFDDPDVAGTPATVSVTALDPFGNVAGSGPDDFESTVDLSSTDGQVTGLPSTYTFTAGDAGSHTFMGVVLKTAGNQTITGTDSTASAVKGTSPSVMVSPAAAAKFRVTTNFADPDVAGTVGTVTVVALDPFGNVVGSGPNPYEGSVDLSSSDGQVAGLPSTYAFNTVDAGSHTFMGVVLKTAGNQTIAAIDSVTASIAGTSSRVVVAPATAATLVVTTNFADLDVAGSPANITVTALDAYNNVAGSGPDDFESTVDLSSTDGQVTGLPATYTFTAANAGSHIFAGVVLKTAGNQTITGIDSTASSVRGTSSPVTVIPAAAATFQVTTSFADPDVAGTPATVTVTAFDAYNNVAGSGPDEFESTVDMNSTDGLLAGLPASYTFTAASAGSHTFAGVVFKTAGNQTITGIDSAASSVRGTSPSVMVIPAAAAKLQVTTSFADPDVAGTPATVTVTAVDPFGNVAGSGPNPYEDTVSLSGSDGQLAGLPSTYSFTAADAGSHAFSGVVLVTAGNQTFMAIDSVTASIAGTSPSVVVAPATAAKLVVTTSFADPDIAGTPGTVTVTALDAYNNVAGSGPDDFESTVDLSSTDGQVTGLPATYSFTAADAGSHSFNVALKTAGSQTITAIDSATGSIAGASPTVTVVPAAHAKLAFDQQPAGTTAGAGISPAVTVRVEDPFGNVVTADSSPVTVTLSSGTFAGGSTTVAAAASGGVAAFAGLTIDAAGTYTIAATGGALAGTGPSLSFAITPAAPDRLVIQIPPSPTATAGQAFATQPVVDEEDRFGNVESGDNSTVITAVIAGGTGSLEGTATATVSRGVATFTNLVDSSGGTISLEFESRSLSPAMSSGITVAASGPAGGGTTLPTPAIISASMLATRKTNRKGKPVGKPVFTGFTLDFSTAMNPATAGLAADYQVSSAVIRRVKKRKVTVLQPVNVTAVYNPSAESVTLTVQGNPKFTNGGQIKVIAASPNGVSSAAGIFLDANETVLSIQPKARGITL